MTAPNSTKTCTVCAKPFSLNPITGEYTCFVHGDPDGSELERRIWNETTLQQTIRTFIGEEQR